MEAQASSISLLLENETSQENWDPVITEKMLIEEKLLEEQTVSEERKLREKVQEEKKKEEEEQCVKRLRLLLSRSSVYAQFMADKLKKHNEKMEKLNKDKFKKNPKENKSARQGTKRKAATSKAQKRAKTGETIADFFKNQNGNDNLVEECDPNVNGNSSKLTLLERQPKLLTGGIMREYQIDGYEWLKTLYENGVNGILADEMGLGKTIQSIAFIAHLIEMNVSGPFFVCGPLSTVPNWYSEFKRFVPDVPVILYHGEKDEREKLRRKIPKKVKNNDVYCSPVVITSYQIALKDAPQLAKIEWKMLVIDEAHRIKNFQCKLIEALKRYNAVHRLLLTGTPLQNNLTELWSLLNFILPEIFDDLKTFQSWFDITRLSQTGGTQEIIAQEQEKQIVSTIHQILTPFLLRRTKSDVELSLPLKKIVVVRAPMTQLQQKYYNGVLNYSINEFENEDNQVEESVSSENGRPRRMAAKNVSLLSVYEDLDFDNLLKCAAEENISSQAHNQMNNQLVEMGNLTNQEITFSKLFKEEVGMSEINLKLTNLSMLLRKICCHPYLVSYPLDPCTHDYLVDENIVKASGKMLVLDILLSELKKQKHKVLLFSQFVTMLEILEDYCTFRNFKFTKLIGTMSLSERQEQMKIFNEDKSVFVFLISTRAGGLGVNLTAADTVIFYDTDWNPQADLQAQDRCHRIGQTKPVNVYHLVATNTYDEKVFNYASAKRKLEKVIIQKGRFKSKDGMSLQQGAITKEELLELLESSDANGFVNADNFVIPPKELKNILDRSKSS